MQYWYRLRQRRRKEACCKIIKGNFASKNVTIKTLAVGVGEMGTLFNAITLPAAHLKS